MLNVKARDTGRGDMSLGRIRSHEVTVFSHLFGFHLIVIGCGYPRLHEHRHIPIESPTLTLF